HHPTRDARLYHVRPVQVGEAPRIQRGQLGRAGDPRGIGPDRGGDLRDAAAVERRDLRGGSAAGEVVVIGAIVVFVENEGEQRHAFAHSGVQLRQRHQEATVADRQETSAVGSGHRRPDGGGQTEPDAAEVEGEHGAPRIGYPQPGQGEGDEVAAVDYDRTFGGEYVVEPVHHRGRVQPSVIGPVIAFPARVRRRRPPPARRPRTAPEPYLGEQGAGERRRVAPHRQ